MKRWPFLMPAGNLHLQQPSQVFPPEARQRQERGALRQQPERLRIDDFHRPRGMAQAPEIEYLLHVCRGEEQFHLGLLWQVVPEENQFIQTGRGFPLFQIERPAAFCLDPVSEPLGELLQQSWRLSHPALLKVGQLLMQIMVTVVSTLDGTGGTNRASQRSSSGAGDSRGPRDPHGHVPRRRAAHPGAQGRPNDRCGPDRRS